jgi:hypothetical protein
MSSLILVALMFQLQASPHPVVRSSDRTIYLSAILQRGGSGPWVIQLETEAGHCYELAARSTRILPATLFSF